LLALVDYCLVFDANIMEQSKQLVVAFQEELVLEHQLVVQASSTEFLVKPFDVIGASVFLSF
jgi:hypothetical protein